ncbi:MAG: GNAT family N-acetyltransferase [Neisseriaceae bacterium]|nr:GNAT family N-acetyltransferase [Neisseriaceae bacterium]
MSGVTLRPLSENDLNGLHSLLNNSDNQDWVGGDLKPYSQNDVYQWWQNKINNPSTYFSAVDNNGQFCGYVQIVNINTTNGHGVVGINLLTNHQGVGLGFQAMT